MKNLLDLRLADRRDEIRLPGHGIMPLNDLDRFATPLRRLQHQFGDGGSMTGDLAVAPRPLAAAKEKDTLFAPR
jgi:hypothetical protein